MFRIASLWAALASVFSVPGFSVEPLPASLTAKLEPSASCSIRLAQELPPGQMAIRLAPPELKAKLRENWKAAFNPASSGSLPSIEVLMALDEDHSETGVFVAEVIRTYLSTVPLRDGGVGLLSGGLSLLGPKEPIRALATTTQKRGLVSLQTPFTKKYGLEKYGALADRLYSEVLPPEYALRGIGSGNWNHGFFTYGIGDAFQAAVRLKLDEERKMLLTLMIMQEDFNNLGDAGQLLGDDALIYSTGLYALSRFYFNGFFFYNDLWDAVELLKRVQTPAMREKVSTLFIDLAADILSDSFRTQLIESQNGKVGEAASHFRILAQYLLRGLKASGTVLFCAWEDSRKVDYFSRSSNPALRAAIRSVLPAGGEKIPAENIVDALMTTDDREELLVRAKAAESSSDPDASYYYAALGMAEKAAAFYQRPRLASREWPTLADTLFRVGKQEEFLAALSPTHPVGAIRSAFQKRAKERIAPENRLNRHGNYLDRELGYYLQREDRDTPEESLAQAAELEAQGNRYHAGMLQVSAAFGLFLRTGQLATEPPLLK